MAYFIGGTVSKSTWLLHLETVSYFKKLQEGKLFVGRWCLASRFANSWRPRTHSAQGSLLKIHMQLEARVW